MSEEKETTLEEKAAIALKRRPWLAEVPPKILLKLLGEFAMMMLTNEKDLLDDMTSYVMVNRKKSD